MTLRFGVASIALAAMTSINLTTPAVAQTGTSFRYDLPKEDLAKTLRAIARISGRQIIISSEQVAGKTAAGLHGDWNADAAVRIVLEGTGIDAQYSDSAILVGVRASAPLGDDIVVTGTRIRGGALASPVMTYDEAEIRAQGVTDMHALASIIPQNFNGGQNPGVGTGAEDFGSENGDSATSLNLRGLGPDATLTLLNGHRLVYDENSQAVDLSIIPLEAVDRVEIMPDGASAIYGSDAVGGVANVILKHDYRGLAFNSTTGTSTDGGYDNQNLSIVAGDRWKGGGMILTGGYLHNDSITAADRSYASSINGNETLYPAISSYSGLASLHQEIGSALSFHIDGVYSQRSAFTATAYDPTETPAVDGVLGRTRNWSYAIAPSLTATLSKWSIDLDGVYGRSRASLVQDYTTPGEDDFIDDTIYRDETKQLELSAQGPLLRLPAGDLRLAIGGGYRSNGLDSFRDETDISGTQIENYAFAEFSAPLISPSFSVPFIRSLTLTGAARYEDYRHSGSLTTPRVGAVWEPSSDLTLKASWGRSFKAPELSQLLQQESAYLVPASAFGVQTAGSTVLVLVGGNRDLKPETASSFSATIDLHPRAIAGLNAELSFFSVVYKNRIATPIGSLYSALSDPQYGNLIDLAPSSSLQETSIAGASSGLINLTSGSYDPTSVSALVDARWRNTDRQRYHGLDASVTYHLDLTDRSRLSFDGQGSYLVSRSRLSADQPVVTLAGTIFNPPHIRGRAGVGWSDQGSDVNLHVNYVGPVTDVRFDDRSEVHALVSVDAAAGHHFQGKGTLGSLDLQLAVLNMFNAKPAIIRTTSTYEQPFDFTNYSAFGRVISVSVTKSW